MKHIFVILALLFVGVVYPLPAYAGTASFASKEIGGADKIPLILGIIFGVDISGLITPFVTKDDENSYANVKPYAVFKEKVKEWTLPEQIKPRIIHYTSNNPQSAKYCAKMVVDSPFGKIVKYALTESTTEVTENYPASQEASEYGETLANWWGIREKLPDGQGMLNYDRPPHQISTIYTDDCGQQTAATPWEEFIMGVNQKAEFPEGSSVQQQVTDGISRALAIAGAAVDYFTAIIRVQVTRKSVAGNLPDGECNSGRCNPDATNDPETAAMAQKNGAWPSNFLPQWLLDKPVEPNAQVKQSIRLTKSVKKGKKGIEFDVAEKNSNSAATDTKYAVCLAVPDTEGASYDNLQKTSAIGDGSDDDELFGKECEPTTDQQCKGGPDTWDQVKGKLGKAITETCNKYDDNLPTIDQGQCEAMMHEIFEIEVGRDNLINPDINPDIQYACTENEAGAAGPFQIKKDSADLTVCSDEYMDDDLGACKTNEKQLSRCMTEDAAEIAMRIILNFSDCNSVDTLETTQQLYDRVCGYYGSCEPLPHLDNKSYCEDVFDAAGIPKPATCSVPEAAP